MSSRHASECPSQPRALPVKSSWKFMPMMAIVMQGRSRVERPILPSAARQAIEEELAILALVVVFRRNHQTSTNRSRAERSRATPNRPESCRQAILDEHAVDGHLCQVAAAISAESLPFTMWGAHLAKSSRDGSAVEARRTRSRRRGRRAGPRRAPNSCCSGGAARTVSARRAPSPPGRRHRPRRGRRRPSCCGGGF